MYRLYSPETAGKRIKMTPEEVSMSELLKNVKFKNFVFYRHHPIGDYIFDFVCEKEKLIIDIYYGFYKSVEEQTADKIRLSAVEKMGYRVLRIMAEEFNIDTGSTFNQIQFLLGLVKV